MLSSKLTKTIINNNQISNQLNKLTSVVQTRNYDQKVIDHYNNPKNVGSFDKQEKDIGTGLVGAPACGDVMKLQIKGILVKAFN